MRSGLLMLWLLASANLLAQPEFTLKSGEQLSNMNQFGQSTEQLEAFIHAHPSRLYDHSQALLLISYNHMQLGDYANALAANEASLDIKAQLHADDLVQNYVRFGAIHLLRGNYHAALAYLLQAKNYPIEAVQLYAVIDGYLAAAYRGLGRFDQAESYYRQSIETLLIEYPEDHPDVITSFYNLAKLYLEWGKPLEARQYFQRGLQRSNTSVDHTFLQAFLYNGIGDSYREDPVPAEENYRKALDVANRHFGNYHRETAQASLSLAGALFLQDRREDAREAILLAMRSLLPEQTNLQWEQLPDSNALVIDRPLLAEALGLKARWLITTGTTDKAQLDQAVAGTELAAALLQTALDDFLDQNERLELLPIARKALEPGIAAGLRLWQEHKDATAQQRAFHLVEAIKLLEFRAYTSHALDLSGTYADRERLLHRNLRLAEMDFRIQPLDITTRKEVNRQQSLYRQLRLEWQLTEPGQYQEFYGWSVLPLADLQQQLSPDEAILSYFVGQEALYLFALDADELVSYNLPVAEPATGKKKTLVSDRMSIQTRQLLAAIDSSDVETFARHASDLYDQLLAPAASWLRSKKWLVILADEALRDVPFESLLTKAARKKPSFQKLNYFLDDFGISYHHAASVWGAKNASGEVAPAYELLFLSPVFDQEEVAQIRSSQETLFDPELHPASPISDGRRFNLLSQADSNARKLEDILGGSGQKSLFRMREAANEQFLKNEFGNAHYVHLASYGFVQGPSPEESGLVLATPTAGESEEDDGLLLASELATLPLFSTDLLSLDLATFGEGALSRPAGITPLSGSIMLAGIPNLLYATRPDGSSLVFTSFYEHLLAGRSMRQALQMAKKELISNKETAAPKYWSAFYLLGG